MQTLIEAWMDHDPKASGWIDVIEFIQLIIELPPPFGNENLSKKCKLSAKKFIDAKKKIFNPQCYYINDERHIIVKNSDIIKILQTYKIKTYNGKHRRVHFKDVY